MKPPLLAFGVAVVAIGFGVVQWLAVERAETALAVAGIQRDRLQQELAAAQRKLGEANQRVLDGELKHTAMQEALSGLFSSEATTTAAARKAKERFGNWSARPPPLNLGQRRIPEAALDTTYHALYRRLGFTAEQVAKFKELALADARRFAALAILASERRLQPTAPELMRRYEEAEAEFKAAITAHFGADAIPVIQHFSETLFLRDAPAYVVGRLFWTDTPVTETQAHELVEILWRNMQDGYGRASPAFANPRAMVAEAEKVLSPPQHAIWREYVEHLTRTSFSSLRPPRR